MAVAGRFRRSGEVWFGDFRCTPWASLHTIRIDSQRDDTVNHSSDLSILSQNSTNTSAISGNIHQYPTLLYTSVAIRDRTSRRTPFSCCICTLTPGQLELDRANTRSNAAAVSTALNRNFSAFSVLLDLLAPPIHQRAGWNQDQELATRVLSCKEHAKASPGGKTWTNVTLVTLSLPQCSGLLLNQSNFWLPASCQSIELMAPQPHQSRVNTGNTIMTTLQSWAANGYQRLASTQRRGIQWSSPWNTHAEQQVSEGKQPPCRQTISLSRGITRLRFLQSSASYFKTTLFSCGTR